MLKLQPVISFPVQLSSSCNFSSVSINREHSTIITSMNTEGDGCRYSVNIRCNNLKRFDINLDVM